MYPRPGCRWRQSCLVAGETERALADTATDHLADGDSTTPPGMSANKDHDRSEPSTPKVDTQRVNEAKAEAKTSEDSPRGEHTSATDLSPPALYPRLPSAPHSEPPRPLKLRIALSTSSDTTAGTHTCTYTCTHTHAHTHMRIHTCIHTYICSTEQKTRPRAESAG